MMEEHYNNDSVDSIAPLAKLSFHAQCKPHLLGLHWKWFVQELLVEMFLDVMD